MKTGSYFDGQSASQTAVCFDIHGESLLIMDQVTRRPIATWKLSNIQKEQFNSNRLKLVHNDEELYLTKEAWQVIAQKLKGSNRRLNFTSFKRRMPFYGAGIIAALIAVHFSLPTIVKGVSMLIPYSAEKWLTKTVVRDLDQSFCKEKDSTESLKKVLLSIGENPKEYTLYIYDVEMVNAFALPAKTIIFTSGFLKQMDSPEEITGVMAHEVQHIKLKHHIARIIKNQLVSLFFAAATGSNGGQFIPTLVSSKYGSEDEAVADLNAIKTLNQRGISANGIKDFFSKIDKKYDKGGGKLLRQISLTHPNNKSRIEMIEKHATQLKTEKEILTPGEFEKLKNCCAKEVKEEEAKK